VVIEATAPPAAASYARRTPLAMARLSAALDAYLAARTVVHGVLMTSRARVLIVGESGIGKSECALDLVVRATGSWPTMRGAAASGGVVPLGTCPELTRHHMEDPRAGSINVQDLFGVCGPRGDRSGSKLVVQLERWDPSREYDRLGLDVTHYESVGVRVPMSSSRSRPDGTSRS